MTERERSSRDAGSRRRLTTRAQREIVPMPEANENASGTHVPPNLAEGGKPKSDVPRSRAALRRRTRTRGT
jgi:hypothetical protein